MWVNILQTQYWVNITQYQWVVMTSTHGSNKPIIVLLLYWSMLGQFSVIVSDESNMSNWKYGIYKHLHMYHILWKHLCIYALHWIYRGVIRQLFFSLGWRPVRMLSADICGVLYSQSTWYKLALQLFSPNFGFFFQSKLLRNKSL